MGRNPHEVRSFSPRPLVDSYTRSLWWMFASSAGALSRVRIVSALRERPRNALQLSKDLGLDYGTIRHHLRVLEKNRLIEAGGPAYGRVYSLSQNLDDHWQVMERILERVRTK